MPLIINGDRYVSPKEPISIIEPEPELVPKQFIEPEPISIIEPEPEPEPEINFDTLVEEETIYITPSYPSIPHELPAEYYEPIPVTYIPPPDIINDDNVLDEPQTKSMGMSDNKIRRYLIDNVWIRYNMPIMAWDKFILSANWLNFGNRVDFLTTLKKECQYLARLPNGTTHQAEYTRCVVLAKNIDLIEEEYEEAPEFAIERFKDKIAGLTLAVKIIIGISIAGGVIFGLFVLYNYLKSYGTELGIKKARD